MADEAITRRNFLENAFFVSLGSIFATNFLSEAHAYKTVPQEGYQSHKAEDADVLRRVCHRDITFEMAKLYLNDTGEGKPFTKVADDLSVDKLLHRLVQGAIEEDFLNPEGERTPYYEFPPIRPVQHYLNPERPPGRRGLFVPFLNSSSIDGLAKAEVLWNHSLRMYHHGDKETAYFSLGRVLHLLQDASVPCHVMLANHHIHLDPEAPFPDGIPSILEYFDHGGNLLFHAYDYINDLFGSFKVLKEGSDYEMHMVSRPIENYTHDLKIMVAEDLAEAFPNMANSVLAMDNLGGYYGLGEINGWYKKKIPSEISESWARTLVPECIGRGAGVIGLFERKVF